MCIIFFIYVFLLSNIPKYLFGITIPFFLFHFQIIKCLPHNFLGPEAPFPELIDFMCAAQMAREEDVHLPEDEKV